MPTLPRIHAVDRRFGLGTASGKNVNVNVNDVWIAATAASREIPIVTRDHGFAALSGVAGLTVIEV